MTYNDTPTKRQQEFDTLEGKIAESLMKLDKLTSLVERDFLTEDTKNILDSLIDAEWGTYEDLIKQKRNF
jgi:hypothetical protein